MTRIDIEDSTYEVPASMNEMTTPQLVFLSELVSKNIPIQEVKVKMFLFCLGAQVKRMKNPAYHRIKIGNDIFALTTADLASGSSSFDFLFTAPDKDGNCFLDNHLTVPPYPGLKCGRKVLFAPGEALTECTYNQYIYLQTYDVMKEHRPEAIYNFLGCMFRERSKPFNPEDLHIRAMKKLKPEQIVLTLWYWIGSCRYIADKFPRIFPTEDESNSGSGTNPYDGQQKLLDYMTKADASKKEAYKKMKLYDVLFSLDYLLEQEEIKQNALAK